MHHHRLRRRAHRVLKLKVTMKLLTTSFFPQSFPDTSKKLAPGTRVVDIEMLDEKNSIISVKDLSEEEELEISIPKTLGKDGNNTLPGGTMAQGTQCW